MFTQETTRGYTDEELQVLNAEWAQVVADSPEDIDEAWHTHSDNVCKRQGIAPANAIAWKYADPTEGACWLYTADKVAEVKAADPSLIVEV